IPTSRIHRYNHSFVPFSHSVVDWGSGQGPQPWREESQWRGPTATLHYVNLQCGRSPSHWFGGSSSGILKKSNFYDSTGDLGLGRQFRGAAEFPPEAKRRFDFRAEDPSFVLLLPLCQLSHLDNYGGEADWISADAVL